MGNQPTTPIAQLLIRELLFRPIHPFAEEFIKIVVGDRKPLGVLFYGSAIENDDPEGILDFYIIVNKVSDWPGNLASHIGNIILPPNVEYCEQTIQGRVIRAKIAILTLRQFYRMSRRYSYDTTVWARFTQPARLVWINSPKAADAILLCLIRCIKTATFWAFVLGPSEGEAEAYWLSLFRQTYYAELRMENNDRPRFLLKGKTERYTDLLREGWKAQNLPFMEVSAGVFKPEIQTETRLNLLRQWSYRVKRGKPLNLLRVIKAAFTFEGGADYVAWKIFRHQKVKITLTEFERHHPVLASPKLLYKLICSGVFKFHQKG